MPVTIAVPFLPQNSQSRRFTCLYNYFSANSLATAGRLTYGSKIKSPITSGFYGYKLRNVLIEDLFRETFDVLRFDTVADGSEV